MPDDGPRPKLADLEAPLALRVRIVDGSIDAVDVDARRRPGMARVLEGRPVESALAALPSLYRLCGTAQGVAGMRAVEAACGLAPLPAGCVARELLVDAEALEQTLWRILLDWPRSVGAPADEAALRRLRKQLGVLRGGVFADTTWCRPGGVDVSADVARLLGIAETVADDAAGVLFGAADPAEVLGGRRAFEGWLADAQTPTASVLRWVVSHDRVGFAADGIGPLLEIDADAVAERLARDENGAYCALPDVGGEVPQTGALARWADAALVRELRAAHGCGLSTQLASRLFEAMALVAALRGHLRELAREAEERAPRRPESAPGDADGRGLGSVDTARGRLFHQVDVRDGRVARYRILAPTEWNFHPRGPLARGLRGARAGDAEEVRGAIALLVSAIDPCVGYELAVEEA